MKKSKIKIGFLLFCVWAIPVFIMNGSCQSKQSESAKVKRSAPIHKVVGMGFLSALAPNDESGIFSNPLSGTIVAAEPVPEKTVLKMSDVLLEKVGAAKKYALVPRRQAMGIYSGIIASDENVDTSFMHALQVIGRTFEADAVLVGYIYRWKERQGSDYAAESAASVCFDLQMVRPMDGEILWKDKYDKTQQSLSENLLDIGTFMKGGGKWMTAEQLALVGLEQMVDKMPPGTEDY